MLLVVVQRKYQKMSHLTKSNARFFFINFVIYKKIDNG
jgi:hypothetical protein